MGYGEEPAFNLPMIGNWLQQVSNSTKRPGTQPRWGGDSGGNTPINNPKPSESLIRTNNAADINKRLAQQKKEREAALGITKGNYDHSTGAFTGQIAAPVSTPDPTPVVTGLTPVVTGPIPQTSRVNGNGVEQKGIDMSRSFAELANEITPGNGRNYSSSQLPATEGSKLSKWSEMIGQASAGPVPPTPEQSGNYKVIQPTDPIYAEAFGEYSAEGIGKAANSSNRLSNALKEVQSEVEMTPERRQAMASMAFYQADGGMEGIKARDAVNKVVYAGGQHYGLGEDPRNKGLGDKFKINRADARNIASGNISSDGLLEQYKDALKSTKAETASAAQDPLSAAGQAVKSQFADAAKTDFAMNNNPSTQVGVGPVVDPKIAETVDLTGDKGERYLKWLDSGAYLTKPFQ